jgi:hypothetical protein
VLTAVGEHVKLIDLPSETVFEGAKALAEQRKHDMAYRAQFGL